MHNFEYPVAAAVKLDQVVYKGISHLAAMNRLVDVIFKQKYSHNLHVRLNSEKTAEAKKQILKELINNNIERGYMTNKGYFYSMNNALKLTLNSQLRNAIHALRSEGEIPKDLAQFTSDDWKAIYKYLNPESFLWGENLTRIHKDTYNSNRLLTH